MTFQDWLRHEGLSESSILKYEGAISGAMSQWAIEGGIIAGPLSSIRSFQRFQHIAVQLRNLPIFIERNARGHSMYESALKRYSEYLKDSFDNDVENDIDEILGKDTTSETEKRNLLKIRIGQGTFRQKLIGYWNGCAVTGYQDNILLVASHIKPWKVANNQERLDHFNGLLLLPTLDKVFDAGLISFDNNGQILISTFLIDKDLLGIKSNMKINLQHEHKDYMKYHRENVFRT